MVGNVDVSIYDNIDKILADRVGDKSYISS